MNIIYSDRDLFQAITFILIFGIGGFVIPEFIFVVSAGIMMVFLGVYIYNFPFKAK